MQKVPVSVGMYVRTARQSGVGTNVEYLPHSLPGACVLACLHGRRDFCGVSGPSKGCLPDHHRTTDRDTPEVPDKQAFKTSLQPDYR